MTQFSDTFQCDGEALVTFMYGESSPAEREAMTSHLARCTACAAELAALGATRQQLGAWTPPNQTLGFQLTRSTATATSATEAATSTGNVLRPAAWWNRPLPAWAQMAAAVVIFASGMAMGGAWSSRPAAVSGGATSGAPVMTPVSTASTPSGVTRQDLAQIEQRLRAEIAAVRTASPANAASGDSRALMQRVDQMIAASEARQQNELEARTSLMARDWANARKIDLLNIENRLSSNTRRVLNNQQDINSLAQRVGYSPAYSPYVP